jgi:hypothetical protein
MPFTQPIKPDDTMDTVRKIARLANLVLQLRTEYERRPHSDLLVPIRERAVEMHELANHLPMPPQKETTHQHAPHGEAAQG